ncbi:MAG: methyltransferase domain-containing protein [Chloroflexi bacterium]|nr:methyltransferase domain-containing protein [Chloroflexota bacterium]
MPAKHLNYGPLASTYHQRYAHSPIAGVAAALHALAQQLAPQRILEVGCGTGRWLDELAANHSITGLDLSCAMLQQARLQGQQPPALVCGAAESLPFPDATFDLVFCVNALHHFRVPQAFISEAWRTVQPGGALAVVGQNPRGMRDRWYVYDYFEGTYQTDLRRFPSWGTTLDWMVACGFERITLQPVEHIIDAKRGREVLDDPFLQKHAVSQLALLSDEAYAAGIQRIRADLAQAEARGETLHFATDLLISLLVGRKPPLE